MRLRERTRSVVARRRGALAPLLLAACLPAWAAKAPSPEVRLPLKDLGFPGYTVALMHAGASMATVHVLDATHLLFTYSMRSLVPRLPGDDANDFDRMVAAEVVEVPAGKVLARAEWHLHDHRQYLWKLGDGTFLLRSGEELSTFSPLRGLPSGTAFQRVILRHRPGTPVVATGSPDGQIATLELERALPEAESELDDGQPTQRKQVTIEFYRMVVPSAPAAPVALSPAGAVGSPVLLRLAVDGDGYLWADDQPRDRWSVSFNEFGGRQQTLATVTSSCPPRLELLSRGEFASITCNGSDDSQTLAAYGFDGHETWEEPLGSSLQPPAFAVAPAAGRFAMSRLSASSEGMEGSALPLDDGTMDQEIRVYQTESGDLLLDLHCMPVARSPENFDLSADGRTLAVLGKESIDLYRLPELSARDRKDLAEVQTMNPPVATGPVVLAHITRHLGEGESPAVPGKVISAALNAAAPDAGSPQPVSPASATVSQGDRVGAPARVPTGEPVAGSAAAAARAGGDAARDTAADTPEAPRTPPTLLEPGETPEFKTPANGPQ